MRIRENDYDPDRDDWRRMRLAPPAQQHEFGAEESTADKADNFIRRVALSVAVPKKRSGWMRSDYEKQMAKDAKAQKRLGSVVGKLSKRIDTLQRENESLKRSPNLPARQGGGGNDDNDDGMDEGGDETGWSNARPVIGGGRGRMRTTRITPYVSINTPEGLNVSIVNLGNGMYLCAETPPHDLRDDQLQYALEEGAKIALGVPSRTGGERRAKALRTWTALLQG
jgi:hypothetical protein